MLSTVFYLVLTQKKVVKECPKNSLNEAKRKSNTANSNLQKFIIFI